MVLREKGHVLMNVAFADVVDGGRGDVEKKGDLAELFAFNTKLADGVDVFRGELFPWLFEGLFLEGWEGGVEVVGSHAEEIMAGVLDVVGGRNFAVVEKIGETMRRDFFVIDFKAAPVVIATPGPEGAAVGVWRENAGEETCFLVRSDVGGRLLWGRRETGGENGEDSGHD